MRHFLGTLVLGSLLAPCALADYRFTLGQAQGQASVAAGAASIATHGINFGAGHSDQRSGQPRGQEATWQELYLKPGVALQYALNEQRLLETGLSLVATHTFGDGDAAGYTRSDDGQVAVEQAFVGVRQGDWGLRLGNQDYQVGSGFIVMDGNLDLFGEGDYWLGPRSAFHDGALLSYQHDSFSAQAFSLAASDRLQGDYRLQGANLDWRVADSATLGALAMAVQSTGHGRSFDAPREGMRVYNLRALDVHLPGLADLTLDAEYALQRGHGDAVQYHASAGYAQANYRFSALPLAPQLGWRHARFSGDSDPGDNQQQGWDPLAKGFSGWSTWLVGDIVGNYLLFNSNERVDQYSARLSLTPTLALGAIHYRFSLDQPNYQGIAVDQRRFADENTLYLDWAPTERLYASVSCNWVKPMAAARQVFGNDTFRALEMYLTYRY
ncbi:alginate export family protein [Pseudomonas faucium]|uniref:alginate export family protein n=1 Tax=Pseudomonas faucium TaxID=2740518 RepID=UPI00159667E0|nr:alginate export family protein [Pseudomonas faucium]